MKTAVIVGSAIGGALGALIGGPLLAAVCAAIGANAWTWDHVGLADSRAACTAYRTPLVRRGPRGQRQRPGRARRRRRSVPRPPRTAGSTAAIRRIRLPGSADVIALCVFEPSASPNLDALGQFTMSEVRRILVAAVQRGGLAALVATVDDLHRGPGDDDDEHDELPWPPNPPPAP